LIKEKQIGAATDDVHSCFFSNGVFRDTLNKITATVNKKLAAAVN